MAVTENARLKPVPASAYRHPTRGSVSLKLELVNAGTWKVVDPERLTDVPAKFGHWAGYRSTKALAWVIDLGYGQWMARCGKEVCNPTNLAEAKRQALAMAVGGISDYQLSNAIEEYEELTAIIEDRYAPEFTVVEEAAPAADTPPRHGDGSTPGALQGDDYPLDFYEDGYPELPAFLDRLTSRSLSRKRKAMAA